MKRTFLIVWMLLCVVLTVGCGGQGAGDNEHGAADDAVVTAAPEEPLSQTLNQTVVKEDDAPKVFWKSDIAYHLENCPTLKEGVSVEAKEIPWSVVREIGLRQCPACNPPRYEGYTEAK